MEGEKDMTKKKVTPNPNLTKGGNVANSDKNSANIKMIKDIRAKKTSERIGSGVGNIEKFNPDTMFITCAHCNRTLSAKNRNYFKANSKSIFSGLGYVPICDRCISELFLEYYYLHDRDIYRAVYFTCRKMDIMYSASAVDGVLKRENNNLDSTMGVYISIVNGAVLRKKVGNFDDSDTLNLTDENSLEGLMRKNQGKFKERDKYTVQEKRAKKDIINLLGINPFETMESELKPAEVGQMFMELVVYVEDEEIVGSPFKMSVVLQVINNNSQIRRFDDYLSILASDLKSFELNQALVTSMTNSKNKLIETNTKIVRENKWLSAENSGGTRLGAMMKKYARLDFEEVEVDYYKQREAKAFKQVFDESNKSILNSINFTEDTERELFRIQKDLIFSKDKEIANQFETNRELAVAIVEYKKKIISLGGEIDE